MMARVLSVCMLVGCANSEQSGNLKWLIDDDTARVMGVVGSKHVTGERKFVLMECPTYSMFVVATEEYYERGSGQLPRGCELLVASEMDGLQLRERRKELASEVKEGNIIGGVLEDIASGLGTGAIFTTLGLSGGGYQAIKAVIEKLRQLKIVPEVSAPSKFRKGLIVLSTLAVIVSGSGLLERKKNEHYEMIIQELNGAQYSNSLQDNAVSSEQYAEMRQMLMGLMAEHREPAS